MCVCVCVCVCVCACVRACVCMCAVVVVFLINSTLFIPDRLPHSVGGGDGGGVMRAMVSTS